MSLKVYVAASAKEVEKARKFKLSLELIGVNVTSSWINSTSSWINSTSFVDDLSNKSLSKHYAYEDLEDIVNAHIVVFLAGEEQSPGKLTEIGYALGINKPIFYVGSLYSIFHHHDSIYHWRNEEDVIKWLTLNKDIVYSLRQ